LVACEKCSTDSIFYYVIARQATVNSRLPTVNFLQFFPHLCRMKVVQAVPARANRVAVSVFFFIAGLDFASWTSRIPDIKTKLHLNDAAFGGILFALPMGLMLSLPASGYLVTRFGSRRIVITFAALCTTVLVFIGLAAAGWQLAALLFVYGFCSNMLNISMNTQAVGVEAGYGRSLMGSFHGLWSSAGFTGNLVGLLLRNFNVIPPYHYVLIWCMVAAGIFIVYRNLLVKDIGDDATKPLFAWPDAAIFKLGIIAFCSMVSEGAMFDWSGVYFQNVVHAPNKLILAGSLSFMFMMAAARLTGDRFITRFGVKPMLQISGCLITAGLLTAVIFPYLLSAAFGFFLVGFGVALVVPMVYGLAGKSKTMSPGVALAAVSSIGFIGFLVGPPLIGFIAQAASLRISFSLIAVLGFGTTLMATVVKVE